MNIVLLISDIIQERGLSYDTRAGYVNHIIDALVERGIEEGLDDIDLNLRGEYARINLKAEGKKAGFADEEKIASYVNTLIGRINSNCNYGTWPNGKIDGDFSQSNVTGDCWLLASIKALAMSPKGLKILNDSIKVNDRDKTVTVTLKGVGKSYTFDFYELAAARELSSGDLDVRAIEMAVNEYFREQGYVNDQPDINGNWMHVAYNILTGQGGWDHWYPKGSKADALLNSDGITDAQINNFNKSNHIVTVATVDAKTASAKTSTGETVELHTSHAYAVKGSDKDYVYIVNPWDTRNEEVIKVPRETFKDFFDDIDEFDLSKIFGQCF